MKKDKNTALRIKVGKALRKWRLKEGLVLTQISKKIKISQGSLSDLENGKNLPAFITLMNLHRSYPETDFFRLLFG